jgi:hypothetical protein
VSIIASPWPVVHVPRAIDPNGPLDDHNNPPLVVGTPVMRKVMSITQFGRRGSSREVISPDYLLRTETTIHISVADPTVYDPDDLVYLYPDFDDTGTWVSDSGIAFWVDGVPSDERTGPWPWLLALFGGIVKLRRVT